MHQSLYFCQNIDFSIKNGQKRTKEVVEEKKVIPDKKRVEMWKKETYLTLNRLKTPVLAISIYLSYP